MRVLVVSNLYPPHHYGGYELSCADVVARFVQRGHEVSVLTSNVRRGHDHGSEQHGVHRVLEVYWSDHRLVDPGVRAASSIERHNRRVFDKALAAFGPEVISFWNMGAMSQSLVVEATKSGAAVVLNVCDDWLIYGPEVDVWTKHSRGRRRVVRSWRSETISACFVSEHTRGRARRAGVEFARSTVVYSGIEAELFLRNDAAPLRPWTGRVLFVGRLDRRKGLATVIRSLKLLPDVTLRAIGGGDDDVSDEMLALAEAEGVARRVEISELPRRALPAEYEAADAVIFASEWDEPFGLVPLEAMGCGTPVVATATGGSSEFLRDGVNCVTFVRGDENGLASAVRRVADDGALRARLQQGGLSTAKQLTTDALADALEEWHLAAADRFPQGVPKPREIVLPPA